MTWNPTVMKAFGRCLSAIAGLLAILCLSANAEEYNVGAYYYPWYGGPGFHGGPNSTLRWHLDPKQEPVLGWYDSHDPSVVSAHFLWARSAGIDFFVASYWGSWDDTAWTNKNCMLTNPDIGNVKIAVFLEPSITTENVGAETEFLCDHFFSDPGYYREDGKPVIYVYAARTRSDSDLAAYINNIRAAARNKGVGEVYIVGDEVFGYSSRSSVYRCGLYDAITAYDTYGNLKSFGARSYASTWHLTLWKLANDGWRNLAHSAGVDFIPCVTPGFNDTAVRTGHNPMSRKLGSNSGLQGSLFAGLLDRAKQNCDRRTIVITSWNEWHEDTQIEPVSPAPETNVVDGTDGSLTDGLYYYGYDTLYLDILRDKTSDVPPPPASPSNPRAHEICATEIRWVWQDNSGNEDGFRVYAGEGPGLPATLAATLPSNATEWSQAGLLPNGRYSFQVTAFAGESQSLRTPSLSVATLPDLPSAGQNIACSHVPGHPYGAQTAFVFSNPAGFGGSGPWKVSSYQYAWDTNSGRIWTGTEPVWQSGALELAAPESGQYWLHVRSLNQAGAPNPTAFDYGPFLIDATAPASSADPAAGVYPPPLTVRLSANEPAAVYYTTDGSEPGPGSTVYTKPLSIGSDATLRFYSVDTAGNAEPVRHTADYRLVQENGSIAATRKLASGSKVRLGRKVLHWKSGTLAFIEEPDRATAIRILGTALPEPGGVCLTGTVQRISSTESRIVVDAITRIDSSSVRPLGASIRTLKQPVMSGLSVRVWGQVKAGSLTADSFVLVDGSDTSGIRVISTDSQGTVEEGSFAIATGAVGFSGSPVIYASEIEAF